MFICFSFISLVTQRQVHLILEFGDRAFLLPFLPLSPHFLLEQIDQDTFGHVFAKNQCFIWLVNRQLDRYLAGHFIKTLIYICHQHITMKS